MNDGNAKQQIVDKIKSNSNILVTVSTNPSVDELSAALGLTVLLNKMNKHATAVFSGAIPPAITFLDPQKTFENTVDSLRDFIIALDKEKADHLRYKVDGDVVKIFITPYRTTISSDDLDFSQGDYNVELVLALGVKNRDYLDGALAAHGRILHDATVVTMSAGSEQSDLGSIDWHEENASSLSEMLVGLCDAFKSDKPLLDEQIATSFLTGIVAATDRFSNDHTSSRVMTMAAQLMSAGANQQLIASQLEAAHEIGPTASSVATEPKNSDGTTDLSEGESTKVNQKQAKLKQPDAAPAKPADDGSLTIAHEQASEGVNSAVEQPAIEPDVRPEQPQSASPSSSVVSPQKTPGDEVEKRAKEVVAANQQDAAKVAEQNLARQLASTAPVAKPSLSVADMQKDLAAASEEVTEAAEQQPGQPLVGAAVSDQWQTAEAAPSMGGTLNATAEQAAEDKRRTLEDERNRTILSHNSNSSYMGSATPAFQSPLNAATQQNEEAPIVDPFKDLASPHEEREAVSSYAPPLEPLSTTTLADIDKQNRATPHDEARAAVHAAFGAVPFTPPAAAPVDTPASTPAVDAVLPPPPMPDFSTLPPLPSAASVATPMGGLPPDKLEDMLTPAAPVPPPPSNDPAQFKIPGQS
jgi:hypothetical protein